MKKIILSLLLAGSLLTSCDMDLEPKGSILDSEAIETAYDCERYRNGIYNNIRALSTGPYIYYTEIQMDNFLGTIMNGNRIGNLANGIVLSSDTDIESIWGGLYGAIASCNFFLPHAEAVLAKEDITADEKIDINRYIGETYFARGYFYFWLLDHYCPNNTSANAAYGLPIVTEYQPTPDKSVYPDRSSLADTYKFIEDDLTRAYDMIKAYEESGAEDATANIAPNAIYLNSYTVRALQARLALIKGDYTTAKQYAEEVINSGIWEIQARMQLSVLWTYDGTPQSGSQTCRELIFRPISTPSELGISSTGSGWISTDQNLADYIPSADVTEHLYATNDSRRSIYIGRRDLLNDGTFFAGAPAFIKYPGNPNLLVSDNPNLMNMAKPFRISEQYLIAAECAAELGLTDDANKYLYELRRRRILGATAQNYTGDALIQEIRTERDRELIGEGFRMSDLRRWGLGFERNSSYTTPAGISDILVDAGTKVVYQPNDYRYTWPIPATEIQVNPHLEGQQNPGY